MKNNWEKLFRLRSYFFSLFSLWFCFVLLCLCFCKFFSFVFVFCCCCFSFPLFCVLSCLLVFYWVFLTFSAFFVLHNLDLKSTVYPTLCVYSISCNVSVTFLINLISIGVPNSLSHGIRWSINGMSTFFTNANWLRSFFTNANVEEIFLYLQLTL